MKLTTAEKHQLKVAKDTLKMPDAMVAVMGEMTKQQAEVIVKKLERSYSARIHSSTNAQ